MKYRIIAGLLAVASVAAADADQHSVGNPRVAASAAAPVVGGRCDRAHQLRVLFVGNSFTYVHNVPRLVQGVALGLPGPCIESAMIAVGGATLEEHWRSDSVVNRIRNGSWTHVVLNDQSTFGESWWLEGRPRVGSSGRELMEFGRLFAQVVHEAGAKPVFLAHWADADAPPRDQGALDYLFLTVARETSSGVAWVGQAIKRMQADLPQAAPYFTDKHHLSPSGAYVEALVLYGALTGRSAVGAPGRLDGPAVELNSGTVTDSVVALVNLSAPEAEALQRIALTTTSQSAARVATIVAPAPLAAEFPRTPENGDSVARRDLSGHWRALSLMLPNPAGDSVVIDFQLGEATDPRRPDTLHMRAGELHFAGLTIASVEGRRILIHAEVLPQQARSRARPQPLVVDLEAALLGGRLLGVGRIGQRLIGSSGSFNAIGRFEARRVISPM